MHMPHTGPMTRHDMPSGQHANGSAEPEKLNPAPPVVKFMPEHWPKGLVAHAAAGSEPTEVVASATAATCALPPEAHRRIGDGERRKMSAQRAAYAHGLSSSSF